MTDIYSNPLDRLPPGSGQPFGKKEDINSTDVSQSIDAFPSASIQPVQSELQPTDPVVHEQQPENVSDDLSNLNPASPQVESSKIGEILKEENNKEDPFLHDKKEEIKGEGIHVESIKVYQAKGIMVMRAISWTFIVIFMLVVFNVFYNIITNLIGSLGRRVVEDHNFMSSFALIFYICGLALIVYRWYIISYEIKSGKVIFMKKGLLAKDIKNYSLTSVESVIMKKSIMGKLLNYGSLFLEKPAHRDSESIEGIPEPERYQRILELAVSSAPLNPQEEDFK